MRAPAARSSSRRSATSRVDTAIVLAGLLAAALSGVAAWREAGHYGDTFLSFGLYRVSEDGAATTRIVRRVVTDDGLLLHYVFDRGSRNLVELRVMPDGAGGAVIRIDLAQGVPGRFDLDRRAVAWDPDERRVRIGFSLSGRGRLDAWQYWNAGGQLDEIRVSRRSDGVVDRWEYYDEGQLARVEEDADHDGRVDRWQTFEGGILLEEAVDGDGDGRPDRPGSP